jgi:glycosyltransferase involved in cell wall biosynthesis
MVVVNARFLTQRVTGVQRFAIELSKILKERLGDHIKFVTCKGVIHKELYNELQAETIGLNRSHMWEQVDLFLYLRTNENPLLISFSATGPIFYQRQIVTIHDMAFKFYKHTFSKLFALTYNLMIPRLASKCIHVFTVSNTSKADICRELNLPQNKVSVVYNGISSIFKIKSRAQKKEKIDDYILAVSSHHLRKNYERLVQAFDRIEDTKIKLIVVGSFVKHFSGGSQKNLDERIVLLDNVSDEELRGYYANARLFVFPSLYEGFGIPLIEAMSQELPCAISDIPVFREIGQSTMLFFDPYSIESIASALNQGLSMERCIKYSNLEKFDWTVNAQKVLQIIKKSNGVNFD